MATSLLISLTKTSDSTAFSMSADKIMTARTVNSTGAEIFYLDNGAILAKEIVTQSVSTIQSTGLFMIPVTLASDSSTLYLNADRIIDVVASGANSKIIFNLNDGVPKHYIVTETQAALRALVAAIVSSGSGPVVTGVTAFAGGGQASATQLGYGYSEITTVATALDSVKLPAAQSGASVRVKNDGANIANIYPITGSTIDDGGANSPIPIGPGAELTFTGINTTNWETEQQVIETDTIVERTAGAGVTVDGVLLKDGMGTFTSGAAGVITIDADTTDHTAGNVVAIDLGVNSASVNAVDISADVKTALSAGETMKGINVDANSLAADADTSAIVGYDATLSAISTSRADLKGVNVVIDGTMDTADTITGVFVAPTATVNQAAAVLDGIKVDVSGVTNTSSAEMTAVKIVTGATGNGILIDADTTDKTAGAVVDIDLGVDSASVSAVNISADVKTALSAGEVVKSVNVDTNALAADADTSGVTGVAITASTIATSRADIKGVNVITDGTMDTADTIYGVEVQMDNTKTGGSESACVYANSNVTLNHASETHYGLIADQRDVVNTSSSEIAGVKVRTSSASKGLVIDASTVDHASGVLIDIDADVADIAAGELVGVKTNMDETVVGTDSTAIVGNDVAITGFATGRADIIGSRVTLDGTKNGGDATTGILINADGLTVNNAAETFKGLHIDASSATNTSSASFYGAHIQVPATATAALQTDGLVNSTKNAGTVGAGTVTAVETGDGRDMTTVLTLTNFVVGAIPGAGALAVGNIVYTFPAGVHVHQVTYTNFGLTITGTAQTPVWGIGSVVGSGAVAVLNGTPTFMDYVTEQTAPDSAGTLDPTGPLGATAGLMTGISLNKAGDVKAVHLNAAETWAADNNSNLLANGTITLRWTKLS